MTSKARPISSTMREALAAAASEAGLWAHHHQAGYYVPGLGTVPFNRRTVDALVSRGLALVVPARLDHEAVYAERLRLPGVQGLRVRVTEEGSRASTRG